MIYLDNSASSISKPDEVLRAVAVACRHFTANPGRSSHPLAIRGAKMVETTRKKVADYLNLKNGNIIFTDNCTGALNLAILGLNKRPPFHIVTTVFEHNALLRPIYHLVRQRLVTVSFAKPKNALSLRPEDIISLIRPDTALVAVGHISNLTGSVAPIYAIGKECHARGITFLVDGAQSVGFCPVDMEKNNIDMLAFSPHKGLRSITGVGVLAVKNTVSLSPVKFGGTGNSSARKIQPADMPDGFEAGTLPSVAICALCSAVVHKNKFGESERQKTVALSRYFYEKIKNIRGVTVYCENADNGIIPFNVGELSSVEVSEILSSQYGICTRAGLHCAPLIHEFLGTSSRGAVRVSIGCDNTIEQLDFTLRALAEIAEN
ncbi:MAG: aminotransferase class V-fold PLP-dependent enzyme [Clostridia bacterium]|nr:aminotransferase class V-fold PLP-dependent enzyme [Clostridia bacterium]